MGKLKQVIVIVIVVAMVCGIAACGSPAPAASTSAEASAASTTTDAQGETAPESGGEVIELEFWMAGTEEDAHYRYLPAAIDVFNERNQDINVKVVVGGAVDEYDKKISLMADSNSLPDFFNQVDSSIKGFGEGGVLTEIGPYIEKDEEWSSWVYVDGSYDKQLKSQDGKIYGVPSMCSAAGFFYNKTMFDEQGLKIPETWDEFMTAIKTFKGAGITPIGHGASDLWSIWGYFPFLNKYGIEELGDSLKDGSTTWSESMVAPFEKIKEMADAGAFPEGVSAMTYGQALEGFIAGEYPMLSTGSWELTNLAASEDEIVFNWGPSFSDSEYEQKVGLKGVDWTIYAGSSIKESDAKMEAALKFMKFMCSPEAQQLVLGAGFCFPSYQCEDVGALNLPPLTENVFDALNDDYKAVDYSYNYVDPRLMEPCRNTISSVITGSITPEEAAKQMDDFSKLLQ